jgi:hypothetical protein
MWRAILSLSVMSLVSVRLGCAEVPIDRILLPIEVLGTDGTTESRTVFLETAQSESLTSLYLQVHGLRYPEQASGSG